MKGHLELGITSLDRAGRMDLVLLGLDLQGRFHLDGHLDLGVLSSLYLRLHCRQRCLCWVKMGR